MSNIDIVVHGGNRSLIECLKISVISTYIKTPMHIHATGLRGIGKTTVIRAFKSILPEIEIIKGCRFNCSPDNPVCPIHSKMSREEIESIGTEYVPMPFLEISHSAKAGTVAGSVDIAKLIDKDNPQAALLLGTIPRANRGIIFLDEINRLADTSPQITDILLDVMGTKPGRIQIEETGLSSIELPVTVSVWAASNPDEEPGHLKDIRKQLSDRFDFEVNVKRPEELTEIKDIICSPSSCSIEGLKKLLIKTCTGFTKEPIVHDDIYMLLAQLYKNFSIESIRPIKSILQGAKILSMIDGRESVTNEDIASVIELMSNIEENSKNNMLKYLKENHDSEKGRSDDSQDNLPKGIISKWTDIARKNLKSRKPVDASSLKNARPLWEIQKDRWVVSGKEIKKLE